MNLNEAYTTVIKYLISEGKNTEYIEKLNDILSGIVDCKNIEQRNHPKHKSILLFGHNIFIFKDSSYIEMAKSIKEER